jgi:hypothetical protein
VSGTGIPFFMANQVDMQIVGEAVGAVYVQSERGSVKTFLKRTELADELATLTRGRQTKNPIGFFKNEAATTVNEAAKLAGISHGHLDRYRAVKARGTPEVIEAMKAEKIKVHAAYQTAVASGEIPPLVCGPHAGRFKISFDSELN